jgi:hypothetical protein
MRDVVETFEYKGYTIKVYQDEDSMNPRTDWDNACTMTCLHRRYNLGDKHHWDDSEGFLWDIAHMDDRLGRTADFNWDGVLKKWDSKNQYLMEQAKKINFILPLFLYDHGGITMSTGSFGCRWDSGQVGWLWISKERARGEWPLNPEESQEEWENRVHSYMEGEVEVYDHYLTGQVYSYVIKDEDEDIVDSCGGWFGDYEPGKGEPSESGLYEEAVSMIDHAIERKAKEEANRISRLVKLHVNKLKGYIKNHVPMIYRKSLQL